MTALCRRCGLPIKHYSGCGESGGAWLHIGSALTDCLDPSPRGETTALRPMTCVELVQSEARQRGVHLTAWEADYILWNHTGFPGFWPARFANATEAIRSQVADHLAGLS